MDKKYEILGVRESDSLETIKKAYREMSKKYHPDANGGAAVNEELFKIISQAYGEIIEERTTGNRTTCGADPEDVRRWTRDWKGAKWVRQAAREGVIEGTVLFLLVLKVGFRILAILGAILRTRI